jgi:hypothetical protein
MDNPYFTLLTLNVRSVCAASPSRSQAMNVANQFVKTLAAAGVKRIYAVVGGLFEGL